MLSLDALNSANDDQRVGIDIVRRALQAPARQIAINVGVDGSIVVGTVKSLGVSYRTGYSRIDVSPEADQEWGGFCAW
jgi:chaperonin GroEL (HSP60 family)